MKKLNRSIESTISVAAEKSTQKTKNNAEVRAGVPSPIRPIKPLPLPKKPSSNK